MSTRSPGGWPERPPERLEQRIVIESDGTVTARSGKVEYGQGIRTGFAKIVAEELDVPFERVRVELGETDRVPWDMGTFGSMSTGVDGKILRAAAAYARNLLLQRASQNFGVPVSALKTQNGCVVAPGRSVRYEELALREPLTGVVPAAGDENFRPLVGADGTPLRLEALDIVTGRARYPADIRLPGMLRGHVLHAPAEGAELVSVDDRTARSFPGVVEIVRDGHFIGVVAERDEQALAAVNALEVRWRIPEAVPVKPIDIVLRRDDEVDRVLASASRHYKATYEAPHVAHASIGPSSAVADVRDDHADLYVAVQRPFGLREEVSELLGLALERVHIHPQMMSGMYGRGNMGDAAIDAVLLSRAMKRPVLVQWTRAEEFRFSPQRPTLDAKIHGALDDTGAIVAWRYDVRTNPHAYGSTSTFPRLLEMTSGRNAIPPYRLGSAEVLLHVVPGAVRTGAFRSLAAALNVFAIESFIDELAHASGQDPIAFRLRLAEDPRLRRVLELVRERSPWEHRRHEARRGFGVACAIYHGTYVAQVAEIVVEAGGRARLEGIWCAVDAGRLVHPDGARNQIEGGIQQAASWTLLEELHHRDGEVITASWQDYPIATFHDAPRSIDVVFHSEKEIPSTGTGEPGSVPTAAAMANAVFDACGRRVRRLPLSPAAIIAAPE
jgi:CO/xanthine dehydrogenase Mo-binding subunit